MKHEKKHKKKKSSKSSKKSKRDRKDKKQKYKEKKRRDKKNKDTLNSPIETSAEMVNKVDSIGDMDDMDYCGPSIDLMNRAKCPETKAEYDHRQNIMKRVVDPETGRVRLIKGDGEILEEIVPRERHKQINQEATRSDGLSFQKNTIGSLRK